MRLSLLIILLLTTSCTLKLGNRYDLEKRNKEEYFANTGIVQYFLPDLPAWANTSVAGQCNRSSSIRFFDLKSLRASFSLNYEKALQMQLMYNKIVMAAKHSAQVDHINIKEEERIFSTVVDRVHAGIKAFKAPTYKRVNFIWVDHALSNKSVLKRLKEMSKKQDMNLGHPVFVSLCLDAMALQRFVKDNKFYISNARYFSAELFSPYSAKENKRLTKVHVDLSSFMKQNQKLYMYTPNGQMPSEIMGKLKIRKY